MTNVQRMKIVILLVLCGLTSTNVLNEWDKFKKQYMKQYASRNEEIERQNIFVENVNKMRAYQQKHRNATFRVAINHLADRRIDELISRLSFNSKSVPVLSENIVDTKDLPASLDWRTKGVIASVRNQGMSGEIETAIVSTELVESLYAIRTGKLVVGSVNRVFDCCPQPIDSFTCIQNMSGLCQNNDYPAALGKCERNQCKPFTNFRKIIRLESKREDLMLVAIQESTLWAELDVTEGFLNYAGGIYKDSTCSQTTVDHVMQIVGYGVEDDTPYWICKNSWGENWGEQGYIRIERNKNTCAIANFVIQVAEAVPQQSHTSQLYPMNLMLFLILIFFQNSLTIF